MNAIELFAGAGGLGLGVSKAGFNPSAVIEIDKYCCDTIRENQERGVKPVSKWPLIRSDVREIDFTKYEGKIHLVSGGPPCQPFSMGGKHKAHADARDMFPEAVRALRQIQPKAFIFENVKGLTRASFASYFEYIRLQMMYPSCRARKNDDWTDHLSRLERHHTKGSYKGLTYNVVTRVLNAADYGVPQRRERVFFVGFRDDLDIEWNFPTATHSQDSLLWDQLNETYWDRHQVAKKQRKINSRWLRKAEKIIEQPKGKPWATVRDTLADMPDPEREPILCEGWLNHRYQPGARSYPGHTGSPVDEPAKTLKAGVHGVPGGENMLLRPDGSVRYFTVRESARLQNFPDDFLFHGSWSETMRQLGNAVPVNLAILLAKDVAKNLKNHAWKK